MNESDQTMTRYLLGEMPEAEQTTLEQRYFSDSQLFDQVVQAENELVDKYARGLLSPGARDRFERYYLAHPKRRERAKFAEALTAKLDQINDATVVSSAHTESLWSRLLAPMRGPRLAWASSMALSLLTAGAVWLVIETRRLHQELARNEAERVTQEQRERDLQQQVKGERTRADQLASELDRLRSEQQAARPNPTSPNAPTPTFASLILTVAGVRGAETGPPATLVIPSGTEKVRLQLNLKDNDYSTYTSVLQTADGKQIFRREGPQPRSKSHPSLEFIVPANRFSNGDYILTLKGVSSNGEVEDVSKSLFRVEKK